MSLQTRAVAILTKPADEWRVIAAESATVEGLMRSYAAPLAAIPAIAQFIGFTVFGITGAGGRRRHTGRRGAGLCQRGRDLGAWRSSAPGLPPS